MLEKKSLAGQKVEVTFRMPPMDDVVELYLCGDFNGWKVRGVPLVLEPDGTSGRPAGAGRGEIVSLSLP